MNRRKTTDAERLLFRDAIAEARPIALAPPPDKHRRAKQGTNPSTLSGTLDGNTQERLRRGRIAPDATIDLHGFTERDAHNVLLSFLRISQQRRHKLVLVVTGKGARLAPDAPFHMELNYRSRGILRAVVPRWLHEPVFAQMVADTRVAHNKHGGEGAFYVYLRKHA